MVGTYPEIIVFVHDDGCNTHVWQTVVFGENPDFTVSQCPFGESFVVRTIPQVFPACLCHRTNICSVVFNVFPESSHP